MTGLNSYLKVKRWRLLTAILATAVLLALVTTVGAQGSYIISVIQQAPGPDVKNVPMGSDFVIQGTVENVGTLTLATVTVENSALSGCDASTVNLQPNNTFTWECPVSNITSIVSNSATARGFDSSGNEVTNAVDSVTLVPYAFDISKDEEGPNMRIVSPGDTVDFIIRVRNTGLANVHVDVLDPLLPVCERWFKPNEPPAQDDVPYGPPYFSLPPGADITYSCKSNPIFDTFENKACVGLAPNGLEDPDKFIEVDCDTSTVKVEPPPPPPGGGQGCTPGYWKQPHHFDSWVNYMPGDSFATTFGVDYNKTLLEALSTGGGGNKALGRHATAALLNAANPDVSYLYTEAEVIAMVQQAYASGDFNGVKNLFESENEAGCPLN